MALCWGGACWHPGATYPPARGSDAGFPFASLPIRVLRIHVAPAVATAASATPRLPWPCAAPGSLLSARRPRRVQMSRICDITGKRANNANRVTFSNKKNARLQHVNLQTKRFFSPELNRNVKLKVATSTMRTITKLGLDETAKKFGVDLSKF